MIPFYRNIVSNHLECMHNKWPVHWFNTKYKSMKLEIYGNLSCNVFCWFKHLLAYIYHLMFTHIFFKMRDWNLMHLKIVKISFSPSTTSRKSLPSYLSMNKNFRNIFFFHEYIPKERLKILFYLLLNNSMSILKIKSIEFC